MGGETEMEVADQSCDGGGQDKLRKRHAYTGARPSPKGQRPPHLLIKSHHLTKSLLGSSRAIAPLHVLRANPFSCCVARGRSGIGSHQSSQQGQGVKTHGNRFFASHY